MGHARHARGQPLVILALLLGSWIFLRAMTWHEPAWIGAGQSLLAESVSASNPGGRTEVVAHYREGASGYDMPGMSLPVPAMPVPSPYWEGNPAVPYWQAEHDRAGLVPQPSRNRMPFPHEPGQQGQEPMLAAGHQLMWMAALARVAVPPEIASYVGQSVAAAPAPVPLSPGLASSSTDRWSADAWMLMRREGVSAAPASRPLYGASQIGAVVRYKLAPQSRHRPIAYVRGSSAMGVIQESEVAAGLGMRPISSLPLVLAAEARAFRSGGETSFRPAGLAYTELAPVEMPMGLRAVTYLQGGYVGGAFKTPFIDGQLRLDGDLMSIAGIDLRLGGGIWGGAQKGAKRLDIGPGASARLQLMGRPSQVSMDWRFRVAGDAEPGSGPALTVATGF